MRLRSHLHTRLYVWGFWVLWILQIQSAQAYEPEHSEDYFPIYELADFWQVYDEKYESYVPYIESRHQSPKSMSFWLELKAFKEQQLVFYAQEEMYLLINNHLCREIKQEGWQVLSIDSLAEHYNQDKVFCSFYDEKRRLPLPSLYIGLATGKKQRKDSNPVDAQEFVNLNIYAKYLKYFTILVSGIILLLYTWILNTNTKQFFSFFTARSSLSALSRKDQNVIHRPLNPSNLLLMSVHAMVIGMCLLLIYQISFIDAGGEDWPLGVLGFYYLLAIALVVGLIALKYSGIHFFGLLLGVEREVQQTHFYEYFRLSMLFYAVFAVGIFYAVVTLPPAWIGQALALKYFVFFFHLIQAGLVSFFVIKQVALKSLYLFYYLCITELVPLLVAFKWLF